MMVFVEPPGPGARPAILRRDGRRETWCRACLLAPVTDAIDGLPLHAGWRVYVCGAEAISDDSLKQLFTGNRYGGSHGSMQ